MKLQGFITEITYRTQMPKMASITFAITNLSDDLINQLNNLMMSENMEIQVSQDVDVYNIGISKTVRAKK